MIQSNAQRREIQNKDSSRRPEIAASTWFESWGSWIQVKKIDFPGKFPKSFEFFRQFHKQIRFSRQIIIGHLQLLLGKLFYFLYKSHHFRTYFPCIIRYNNISRPVHDPHDPSTQNLRWSRPPAPRIDAPDQKIINNYKLSLQAV